MKQRKETEKLRIMQIQEEMKWEKKKRKVPWNYHMESWKIFKKTRKNINNNVFYGQRAVIM